MALLPTQKRITSQEADSTPIGRSRLILFLNSFFDAVYTALSGNLTFGENIASQSKQLTFETSTTYSAGDFTAISFPKTIRNRAEGVLLMRIYENGVSNYSPILNAVYIDWYEDAGNIVIGYVTGLQDSTSYTLKLMVI